MAAIQVLVLTFCPTMHCVSQRKLKLLMPVYQTGTVWVKTGNTLLFAKNPSDYFAMQEPHEKIVMSILIVNCL